MIKDLIIAFLLARIMISWKFFVIPTPADWAILFGILLVLSFVVVITAEERIEKIMRKNPRKERR